MADLSWRQSSNMRHWPANSLKLASIFGGISLLLLFIVLFSYQLIQLRHRVASEYAVNETTDMICMYWVENRHMPQSWSDLKDVYQVVDRGYGLGPHGLEELKRTVIVDFDLLRNYISATNGDSLSAEPPFVTVARESHNVPPSVLRSNARIRELFTKE